MRPWNSLLPMRSVSLPTQSPVGVPSMSNTPAPRVRPGFHEMGRPLAGSRAAMPDRATAPAPAASPAKRVVHPALVPADVDGLAGDGHRGERVAAGVVDPRRLHVRARGADLEAGHRVAHRRRGRGSAPVAATTTYDAVGRDVEIPHVGVEDGQAADRVRRWSATAPAPRSRRRCRWRRSGCSAWPLSVVKFPTANRRRPSGVTSIFSTNVVPPLWTPAIARLMNGSRAPVVALSVANARWATPPTWVKLPATHSRFADQAQVPHRRR